MLFEFGTLLKARSTLRRNNPAATGEPGCGGSSHLSVVLSVFVNFSVALVQQLLLATTVVFPSHQNPTL